MVTSGFSRQLRSTAGAEPGAARGDTIAVTLHGTFCIHGVTRKATIPAKVVFLPDGMHVRGNTPLNLKDYKIGGLKKMLGLLKMHENSGST